MQFNCNKVKKVQARTPLKSLLVALLMQCQKRQGKVSRYLLNIKTQEELDQATNPRMVFFELIHEDFYNANIVLPFPEEGDQIERIGDWNPNDISFVLQVFVIRFSTNAFKKIPTT